MSLVTFQVIEHLFALKTFSYIEYIVLVIQAVEHQYFVLENVRIGTVHELFQSLDVVKLEEGAEFEYYSTVHEVQELSLQHFELFCHFFWEIVYE